MGAHPLFSLYLHIPFCRHKCSYCDFNTYAGIGDLMGAYVGALCREVELLAASAGGRLPVRTIYFGGGTPSLLPGDQLARIFCTLEANFDLRPCVEVTLEANPGTLTADYLNTVRSLGVDRLSLGMQSAHPLDLGLLEREHAYEDVIQAVVWARRAGFEDLNLDLIFGLPHQDMERWQRTLALAVGLRPDHLSLYCLTLERGTPLQNWVGRGLLVEPDADLAADMYAWAAAELEHGGYHQYEISNWGIQTGDGELKTCLHNLQYWHNQPYLGVGAGAHGFSNGVRTANVLSPAVYIQRCSNGEHLAFPRTPATAHAAKVDRHTQMQETMLMGLRLTAEGVSNAAFRDRFGSSIEEVFPREVDDLVVLGLLEWVGVARETLRLTARGRLLGNQVFMRFV